MLIENTAVFC